MKIKIKHYQNQFEGDFIMPYNSHFGDSLTDTSKWRPDISIARAQLGAMSGKTLLYDFPDGEDNGETIQTFIRSPGLDITEIDTATQRITQIIEDKKSDDKKSAAEKKNLKDLQDNIKKIADSANPDNPDPASSQPSKSQ